MNLSVIAPARLFLPSSSESRPLARPFLWGIVALLVVATFLLCTAPAYACQPTINLGDTQVTFPTSIGVPTNAPVGSIIATTTVVVAGTAGTTYSDNCGTSGTIYWQINTGPVVPNRTGTTSVSGIGYTASLSGGGLPGTMSADVAMNGPSLPSKSGASYFPSQVSVSVSLVVTGPVGSGALTLNPTGSGVPNVVGFYYVGVTGNYAFRVVSPAKVTTVALAGCTVTTPSIAVTLPIVRTSSLGSVYATAENTPFEIDLTCPAGIKAAITLTDVTNPLNVSTTLGIAPGSTAGGVGLQILNGGTPISFGADSASPGNRNQWFVGVANGGGMKIPLSVQYIRTGPLTPGSVKAKATFTMSYQ